MTVRMGLLLPAVQKVRDAALVVKDKRGNVMFRVSPEASAVDSFFDITSDLDATGASVMVLKDMDGNILDIKSNEEGILIGLLLPAVQKIRSSAKPSANFQLFDSSGETVAVDSFFDIWTD